MKERKEKKRNGKEAVRQKHKTNEKSRKARSKKGVLQATEGMSLTARSGDS